MTVPSADASQDVAEWLRKESAHYFSRAGDEAFTVRRRRAFKFKAKMLKHAADEIDTLRSRLRGRFVEGDI